MPANPFKIVTSVDDPLDASSVTVGEPGVSVSNFLTIQSFTNLAAMTGAITAAWHALVRLDSDLFSGLWVPYLFAMMFGLISILISVDGLKKPKSSDYDWSKVVTAIFIAIINSLVLASAVVGAGLVGVAPAT
jgi:hypothetical protein